LTPFYRRTFLGKIRSKSLDLFLMNKYNLNNKIEVDWLMGSCLLLKKETLEKVGMFDERYFMYFEDTDLCRKIKKNNLKVIYNPEAIVYHDHVRGSAKSSFIFLPFNKLARMHVISWVKYSWKWRKD
ncbi:MAG: hypothetical protein NT091_00355, partial [Candidatus Falkowbacteria bacterium]|nr:hypothetical protein [Candidatus Falkowbacteria bacterium]